MKEPGTSAEAFDHIGARYDVEFTNTELSRWFRGRVWERLGALYQPGDSVLELGCGTGEDAIWLAKRGVRVLASDGSPAMLAETTRKAQVEGVSDLVETRLLDLSDAVNWSLPANHFDGAYSNYGALNCVGDWTAVGDQLARAVKPGGKVGLGVMGRWCVWEIVWHGVHARPAHRQPPPA